MDPRAVADGYSELMSRYALPLFHTQTWDQRRHHPPHPENVVKAHRYYVGRWNDELHGRNWKRRGLPGCQYVLGVEPQKSGCLHSHSVIGHADVDLGCPDFAQVRTDLQEWCYEQWGIARLSVAKSREACNAYVSKYIVKHGDIYISQHLEALSHGQLSLAVRAIR